MCNIAGYAGSKRAAPILIEMLRREEFFDGGLSTGIATIHEGKLYTAKVVGDLDELLRSTDAYDLPGNVGIIHSRTSDNLVSHAHPFTSEDDKLALVLNGTMRDVDTPEFLSRMTEIMEGFLDRGFTVKSSYRSSKPNPHKTMKNGLGYHPSETYALMMGDKLSSLGRVPTRTDLVRATADALSELPADIVVLGVHAEINDTIVVGDITRPMVAGFGEGETYLATTAIAFPEDVQKGNIISIPPASVAIATSEGVQMTNEPLRSVRVEQPGAYAIGEYYRRLEGLLLGKKDAPLSMYEFPLYDAWRDVWNEPYVDAKYAKDGGLLKPYAALMYETLWAFHKEGRLRMVIGERKGHRIRRFWLEGSR